VITWRNVILGARWLILAAVVMAGLIWVALAYQYSVVTQAVEAGLSAQLRAEAELAAALVTVDPDLSRFTNMRVPPGRRLTLIAADGRVLHDSQTAAAGMDNHNSRPEVQQARREGVGISRRRSDTVAAPLLYVAKALPDGQVVRVAAPIEFESGLEHRLFWPMAAAAALVILVSGSIITLHLWRDRTRVAELVAVSRAFGNAEYTRRAGLLGQDTLAHLGHELNQLGLRLQESQDQLARQRSLLDVALGALNEGVAVVDAVDQVLYANGAYRQLAAGGAEVLGQTYYQHLPVLAAAPSPAPADNLGGIALEHRRRHLRVLVAPAAGEVRVIVLHDVTELKRLENARRDFIAAVSHELKTPLTAIAGFSETLLDGVIASDPATARDFVEKISRHAERLATLVRDVLTLSRLEQGAWEVKPAETDLARLGRALLDEYQPSAEVQHVRLELEAPPTLLATTDPELVHQLVGNLVSNAIRYNRPEGQVTLRLSEQGEQVRIAVADTGIGIPAEHRERIFERFYRIDAHRSRQSGGTGLGLAIVKQLVEVLSGTITVESGAEGSIFTVTLPRRDVRVKLARNGGEKC
jgi:two-component system phosphate regulon sensor histidine kinase PhoR